MFGCGNGSPALASATLDASALPFVLRPWSEYPIHECGEPLVTLQPDLVCLQPHPYQALGAPYGDDADPFVLRQGVRTRLLRAEQRLRLIDPGLRFGIFDAWRPISVQSFMVEHAVAEQCALEGLDPSRSDSDPVTAAALADVRQRVGRFWAPPSLDAATPPPHSTGAAVDLTLCTVNGIVLDMGGEIDAIGAVSEPDHYAGPATSGLDPQARLFHQRRKLLATVLGEEDFACHPNEWWHYSYGDQLWAWCTGKDQAMYGRSDQTVNSSLTA